MFYVLWWRYPGLSVSLCSFCSICFVCVVYQGCTPLHIAAEYGHEDTVELLIKHGANVNLLDRGVCALNCGIVCMCWSSPCDASNACAQCIAGTQLVFFVLNLAMIRRLNWLWSDNTRQNKTPLHIAAENGHCSVVELLIDRGANVNAQDVLVCSMSWKLWNISQR